MKRLVIVGGGIAGLATAFYSQQISRERGIDLHITLIEKDNRLGGKIATDTSDGFVIEGGPDSFITQKPWGLQLCNDLGIDDQLIGTNDERRNIYMLRKGKLHQMPDGLMLVVPTRFLPFALSPIISLRGKLRMALDLFIKPRTDAGDESLADFMRRRLGQEALDVLGEPMMAGIHVADAETLSLQATFPRFIDIERKYGSLIRGMIAARKNRPPSSKPMFMTLKGGLSRLVAEIEAQLDAKIVTGTGVESVRTSEHSAEVVLDDGQRLVADAIVLATPAYITGDLLADVPRELTDLLNGIRYVSTATVSLGYRADECEHPLDGFGFVIPRNEPTSLLACTWTSTKFDFRSPQDGVLLRAFIGGSRHEALVQKSDEALIELVKAEFKKIMGIHAEAVVARVFRWHKANPQYDVGHPERVSRIEQLCPERVFLTGSAYRGVGIPDCINQGQQCAESVMNLLTETSDSPEKVMTV